MLELPMESQEVKSISVYLKNDNSSTDKMADVNNIKVPSFLPCRL
jgi:hypothetical protein